MATPAYAAAVKCLNTCSTSRKRFSFKTFSQRVEEIDIDVYRSLHSVKAEPSSGSSFFLDALMEWRELNTAEDFISFYEEMIPLVQTLPQIVLHREELFSALLQRVNMSARLSLEPILMLIAALSRDILEDFLPFLERHAKAIISLLNEGGDRDPEILEQVFTSWSYIMMYLQKYLVKDILQILRITAPLRYFPKDYVREFMAESVSFLLRNAPSNQLTHGLMKILLEATKKSSPIWIDGVTALLCHVMKGTSMKLHSRAVKVLKFLLSKSMVTTIHDKFPDGSSTIHDVMTGLIQRLCDEVDLKELPLIYTCLFEEINSCIKDVCSEHLKYLIDLLTFALQNSKQSDVLDKDKMLELVEALVSKYVLPGGCGGDGSSSKVLGSILEFLLCVLDVPVITSSLSFASPFYAPVFKLTNLSVIVFIKKLLAKDQQIIQHFESEIMCAMNNFIESLPEEVLFILLTFFKGSKKQINLHSSDGNHLDPGKKVCKFLESKLSFWTRLLDDIVSTGNHSSNQVTEMEAAILWGCICCYPNLNDVHQDNCLLMKKLICSLDRLIESGEENINGLPKTTWRSMLGTALCTYHELLMVKTRNISDLDLFVSLAKRHSACSQVLSAVAEYLEFLQGVGSQEVVEEFDPQNLLDMFSIFSVNLSSPNKNVRILSLRILSYFVKMDQRIGTDEERPLKRQRTEDSGDETVGKYSNVVDTLLTVESTPISVSTSRKIAIFISRIQMSISSKMVHDDYIPPLLHGIIGILYNRFSDLWPPVLDCLAVLIRKHKELVWTQFVKFIAVQQSKNLTLKDQDKLEPAFQPQSLFDCFSLYLAMDFDCTPVETIATLLLQSLQRIPDIAESRSRHLIPLFLNFMGYDDGGIISADSYKSEKCKGKHWKILLKEWLNVLRLMHNARSLYQSKILQEVITKRVLDESDPDIQAKALDCILNWKDECLTPYSQNLKNLIDVKSFREELTTWAVSRDSLSIQKDHRSHVVPLIIRVLAPKVRKLKLLGSRKHTGVSHRKAILRFLLQFDSSELDLFFSLLLKSLVPGHLQPKISGSQSESLLRNVSVIVGDICIEIFTWKKANGFLHLIEEIFGTFDMAHISPFLNALLIIVVRLLESCMRSLRKERDENCPRKQSDDSDADCSMNLDMDNNSASMEECPKEMPVADHMEETVSIKQLKDMRSLCIRIVSSALSHYENHDFGEVFWNTFFASVKPMINCFTQEASSSEKPSSLFSCFMTMSRSPALAPLLGTNNLISAIFSILTVKTASGSITSYVLEFIENLLKLDIDLQQQDDHSMKKIFIPHMDVLLHSLHDFVNHRKELQRRSGTWLGHRELELFKLLLNYITDPSAAERFIDLILPFFHKKDLKSDECLDALRVVRGIVPNLRCRVSVKILSALSPLLASVGLELRLCICDIFEGLSLQESSLSFLANLMRDLNAVSTSELGELDYNTRLTAYDKIQPQLFLGMRQEHVSAILSHCVYDMSSEELIFRQSASRALQSFLDFSSSVMNNESRHSSETADIEPGQNNTKKISTKGYIQQILEKTYLHNMGVAMTKDISIQKEWIILLREMVYNFNHIASLSSFRPLCKEDPEADFFHNITHLQAGKRSKALSLFRQEIKENNFSEDITMKIFVPLFFNMFLDVKAGKSEQVRDVCLGTLSSVAAMVQWEHYRTILMRCFRELSLNPDKQKILLRLICTVLDAFHFIKPANNDSRSCEATSEDPDASVTFSLTIVSSDKQHYLQKVVFPQVQKLLGTDPEKVNVNINLVALKILKLLPVDYFESQLSSIIHRICNFLKNRLESIRDEARSALAASLKELGIGYLQFVVKILRAILRRGFELHVLGYTLHFLLSKTITADMNGSLDYCIEDLLAVVDSDLLGDVAEQKEVGKIASKMKETKKRMSFESLKLIAQSVTFRTHALKLVSPISSHLQKQLTPKLKLKLEMMLHEIALGIECNPSTETSNLFIFVYGLVEDTVMGTDSGSKESMESGPGQNNTSTKNFSGLLVSGLPNSYIITKFALTLLRNRLKNIKLDKEDEQLLSMLDPFVNLLTKCLNSKYESVLSVAFRCFALLVKLPLPSLRDNANPIKNVLMDIAQRAGNSNGQLVTSSLKLLADLLRGFTISLSDEQLQMLVHFPVFIDLQTNPSPVALSLLKAIVRRKLVFHEIYDIVVKIGELMVTTQTESLRQQCIQILLQFFLNYPLSEKRLQQHIDFFLANLSYEHPSGREAVLEMLHDMLTRFPQRIIDEQGQTFFLHLVVGLSNEQQQNVSAMILRTIQKLFGRIGDQGKNSIFEYSLSWYTGEKQSLWSASAQVIGLLVVDRTLRMGKQIKSILAVAKKIMESSVIASEGVQLGVTDETVLPYWKEAYHSVAMTERLLLRFPELYVEQHMEEMWILVCKLLIHPHSMLRDMSSSLLASYFATVEKKKREAKMDLPWVLVQPSRLFLIAVSFLKQLRTELSDSTANNLIVQNLAYAVCNLHMLIKRSASSQQFWSSISSSNHGAFLEGFELLGSTKAKNTFLLCTSTSGDIAGSSLDSSEEPTSLLVSLILKRMGKIATQMHDMQTKIVFNCLDMISSALGPEESLTYAVQLLSPLYKVSEGFAGKVVSDEVKQLAESVRDKLRDLIGVEKFVEVYNIIRKSLKVKRDSRKQSKKIIAAVDPARHAKRKLRIAAKHREHKRRKIMAMKIGRWMR